MSCGQPALPLALLPPWLHRLIVWGLLALYAAAGVGGVSLSYWCDAAGGPRTPSTAASPTRPRSYFHVHGPDFVGHFHVHHEPVEAQLPQACGPGSRTGVRRPGPTHDAHASPWLRALAELERGCGAVSSAALHAVLQSEATSGKQANVGRRLCRAVLARGPPASVGGRGRS
jgi:hypothetical protein